MLQKTVFLLDKLNEQFYQKTARDFAASRWQAWPGWKKLLPYFEQKATEQSPVNVLDVGCGGGRLARFLHNNLIEKSKASHTKPTSASASTQAWKILKQVQDDENGDQVLNDDASISYLGIDRSQELLDISFKLAPKQSSTWQANFAQIDLIDSLLNDTLIIDLQKLSPNKPDTICLFAVIHHVPSFKLRQRLIANLADILAPNGLLMISSWQFLNAHKQRDRLVDPTTISLDPTDWEENDFIMDWRAGEKNSYRYCHYMNNEEEIAILKYIDLQVIDDFFADGVTRNMNHYLVLRKK